MAHAGAVEVGGRHGSDAAPASRGRVSQPTDKHVAVRDGLEHGTERGIGRRYGEAKCSERSDCRVGYGSPDTNSDYDERVEDPRMWVTRTGDKTCD